MQAASGLDLFGRSRTRSALAVAEVALATVLLVGGGLLIHSFANLARIDPGYDTENVLTFDLSLPEARYADSRTKGTFYGQLLRGLDAHPGVRSAAGMSALPMDPEGNFLTLGLPGSEPITSSVRVVTPGYFETMGIPVIKGRAFAMEEPEGAIVVNETFARRYFPDGAIGRELPFFGQSRRIIGVVGDVRPMGLDSEVRPEFHINYADDAQSAGPMSNFPLALAVLASGDPMSLIEDVRRVVRELDPTLALEDVRTMEDRLSASVAEPRFYAVLLGIFASVALALAGVGIYGVLAYAVSQRTREIGIRMALGAQRRTLFGMVLSQGFTLTAIGLGAGLLGSIAVTRYLEGMLFGLTPLDPTTFAAMTAILVLTAVVACYLPARRALSIDPMTALRHE